MTRLALAGLALLLATAGAQADSWSSLKAWAGREYCRLYASRCRPVPPPAASPAPIAPAHSASALSAPAPTAPIAASPPALAAPAAPPATKPRMPARPKPKARRDDGPDLPWPCWTIRLYAAGKTTAELEQLGRDRGVALTPKQRRQARACLR